MMKTALKTPVLLSLFIFSLGIISWAQTKAPAAKAASKPSVAVTITGTLVFQGEKPFMGPTIIAAPVSKEQEKADATNVDLSSEGLNKYKAEPDAKGNFRLRVDRSYFTGKKLMILALFLDGRGLQPLKMQGANIVLQIDDTTSVVNLGKIVVK